MADDPDNMVLRYLRRIDEKLDRLSDDVGDLKRRMTSVEEAIAGQSRRFDRIEDRLTRIERRVDLVSDPAA